MTGRADEGDAVFLATRLADLADLAVFVDRACASVGADKEAASDVRLATEEVFTNILQHGYGQRPGPVTVRVDASPERITVILTDDAPAFLPSKVQTPELAADYDERRPGGLGWYLVQQVMDEARHEPGTRGGNLFTLVRKLSVGPSGSRDT